jgi:hypothetical protein
MSLTIYVLSVNKTATQVQQPHFLQPVQEGLLRGKICCMSVNETSTQNVGALHKKVYVMKKAFVCPKACL